MSLFMCLRNVTAFNVCELYFVLCRGCHMSHLLSCMRSRASQWSSLACKKAGKHSSCGTRQTFQGALGATSSRYGLYDAGQQTEFLHRLGVQANLCKNSAELHQSHHRAAWAGACMSHVCTDWRYKLKCKHLVTSISAVSLQNWLLVVAQYVTAEDGFHTTPELSVMHPG